MKRRDVLATVVATGAIAIAVAVAGSGSAQAATGGRAGPRALPASTSLQPEVFAELATGIALIRDFNCAGKPIAEGSGFLVGSSVLMTARHVVRGACHVKVFVDGHWLGVKNTISWYTRGRGDMDTADVTTIKLSGSSKGHVFTIRSWSMAIGQNVAALGHPLGNKISLNQGNVAWKGHLGTVPMLGVAMLSAAGGSGSPLVDDDGEVVGILQIGLLDTQASRTSGRILGIDLPSWWPTAKKTLCKVYRYGGIAGCSAAKPKPAPVPAPPPTAPTQQTGSDVSGDSGAAPDITSVSVVNDALGDVTFEVALGNRSTLSATDMVAVAIDADHDRGTGDATGADYLAGVSPGGALLLEWDGAHFTAVGPATGSISGNVATLIVSSSELGIGAAFDFSVLTGVSGGSASDMDTAPDYGAWTYTMQ